MPLPALALPIAGTALKGIFDYFGGKKKNDAEQEARQLYNDFLEGRAGNVEDIIARLQAQGMDPFGPQTTTQTGSTSQTGQSSARFSQATAPTITPEYKELEELFRGIMEGRLAGPTSSIPEGYVGAVARSANEGAQAARVAAANFAASRGLSGEQALSIAEPIEMARVGRIQDAAADLPLLGRRLQSEDIGLAAALTGQFGKGSQTSGRSSTTSSSLGTSESALTRPPDINSLLSFLTPPSPQAGMNTGFSPIASAGSGLLDALMMLREGGRSAPGGGLVMPPPGSAPLMQPF